MVPLITGEITFGQHVRELVFGVHIFFLGVQIDSLVQPTKCDSVGSGHMSHRRTSAFDDQLDHSFIVLENFKLGVEVRRFALMSTWSTLDSSSTSLLPCVFVLVLELVCLF